MGKDQFGGDSGDGRKDRAGEDAGAKPVDARVARRRQDPIGRRLRQMYDDVVSEDVPDDFMSFLEQADDRKSDIQIEAPQKRALKTES
jgi:hypothetical protein